MRSGCGNLIADNVLRLPDNSPFWQHFTRGSYSVRAYHTRNFPKCKSPIPVFSWIFGIFWIRQVSSTPVHWQQLPYMGKSAIIFVDFDEKTKKIREIPLAFCALFHYNKDNLQGGGPEIG